jgi:hypothetical protein
MAMRVVTGVFQDVTIRLIAERILPHDQRGTTYVQDEIVFKQHDLRAPVRSYHVLCSPYNVGAYELMEELAETYGATIESKAHSSFLPWLPSPRRRSKASSFVEPPPPSIAGRSTFLDSLRRTSSSKNLFKICVTTRFSDLKKCDHMVVYLNGQTWTTQSKSEALAKEVCAFAVDCAVRGPRFAPCVASPRRALPTQTAAVSTSTFAARHCAQVSSAMLAGVHLLLAHEMPGGADQEHRHGCEFGLFFSDTPRPLLIAGIYHQIAIALKGGEWRSTSLAMLLQGLNAAVAAKATSDLADPEDTAEQSDSRRRRVLHNTLPPTVDVSTSGLVGGMLVKHKSPVARANRPLLRKWLPQAPWKAAVVAVDDSERRSQHPQLDMWNASLGSSDPPGREESITSTRSSPRFALEAIKMCNALQVKRSTAIDRARAWRQRPRSPPKQWDAPPSSRVGSRFSADLGAELDQITLSQGAPGASDVDARDYGVELVDAEEDAEAAQVQVATLESPALAASQGSPPEPRAIALVSAMDATVGAPSTSAAPAEAVEAEPPALLQRQGTEGISL